jgi:RNA ligase
MKVEKEMVEYIENIAPYEDFLDAVEAGLVIVRPHPDIRVPYDIFDYAKSTPYAKAWNTVTIASRGLIINRNTHEIIARPFAKFFNDNEEIAGFNDFARTGPVSVTDKADGSMGILYQLPDETWAVSTRGSMQSYQALHATEIYNAKYAQTWSPRSDITYVFEIIYPSNRIVLDYGQMDDLVLLGAIDKATGRSVSLDEARVGWVGPVVQAFGFSSYEEVLMADIPEDREGFVVHFLDQDRRVKLKGSEYIRLHKIMTGVTKLRVWENLIATNNMDSWLAMVPEEFADQVRSAANVLIADHQALKDELAALAYQATSQWDGSDRKALAALVNDLPQGKLKKLVFGYINGNSRVDVALWKMIRPDGTESI